VTVRPLHAVAVELHLIPASFTFRQSRSVGSQGWMNCKKIVSHHSPLPPSYTTTGDASQTNRMIFFREIAWNPFFPVTHRLTTGTLTGAVTGAANPT